VSFADRSRKKPSAFCAACEKDVAVLSRAEAVELIELLELELDRLIEYGLIHQMEADQICKASLFARTGCPSRRSTNRNPPR